MVERMRVSVLTDVGCLEIRDLPMPQPGEHDVLLQVTAVGVCGTDFHIFSGESNYHMDERGNAIPLSVSPQVLGHEIAGIVREVGAAVSDLQVGQRVVVDQGLTCVSERREALCEYCATGDSHQCERYTEYGITGLPGGFAEYLSVPAINVIAQRDAQLSSAEAAMTEPLGCILHSSERVERSTQRYRIGAADAAGRVETILICGAGPAGLLFLQYLKNVVRFDGQILVTELDPNKRAVAERFGATTIDPASTDLTSAVLEYTNGRRVEYLIEATGAGPIWADIPGVLRKQATVLMYGIGHGGASLELMNQVQWKEPTLVLTTGASGSFDPHGRPEVYQRALGYLEDGTIDVNALISHRYDGLDQVHEAFGGADREPGYVKGVAVLAGD
jgi:L-iditol 2-dehydrogenase